MNSLMLFPSVSLRDHSLINLFVFILNSPMGLSNTFQTLPQAEHQESAVPGTPGSRLVAGHHCQGQQLHCCRKGRTTETQSAPFSSCLRNEEADTAMVVCASDTVLVLQMLCMQPKDRGVHVHCNRWSPAACPMAVCKECWQQSVLQQSWVCSCPRTLCRLVVKVRKARPGAIWLHAVSAGICCMQVSGDAH